MNLCERDFVLIIGISEGKSVSEIARELGTSQPGISKRLKQIESDLGCKLFEKNGRHICRITPQCSRAAIHARDALNSIAKIRGWATKENSIDFAISTAINILKTAEKQIGE